MEIKYVGKAQERVSHVSDIPFLRNLKSGVLDQVKQFSVAKTSMEMTKPVRMLEDAPDEIVD